VSFSVTAGTSQVFSASNGSGKSTLIKLANGLRRPTRHDSDRRHGAGPRNEKNCFVPAGPHVSERLDAVRDLIAFFKDFYETSIRRSLRFLASSKSTRERLKALSKGT
jgi:ABC-type multidrug transport system ATPase subunit